MRPALAAATPSNGETDTMTEKQFNEIVARQANPPLGTSSQVKTDMAELTSEISRRTTTGDASFEPEPEPESVDPEPESAESVAGEDPEVTIARSGAAGRRPTSGARKK
jgi:hypothetical protein